MDLDGRLAEAVARHGVPGAAAVVTYAGVRAEAACGVLSVDSGEPVRSDSLFPIASVTKPWTAALVLQLVDDGLLDLDEPVRRYLPEFGVVDPVAARTVTARHLLTHTGGFLGDLFTDTGSDDGALARYLDHLRQAAVQIHPPGEMFSYCNSGFCVLGALVARLRGGVWESVLHERLAAPLRASRVAVSAAGAAGQSLAAGHLRSPGDGRLVSVARWQLPRSNAPAGSMMCAAPRDLVRLGRMLCAGGDGVLSAGAVAAMCTPQVAVPGAAGRAATRWGLGVALSDWDGTTVVRHEGDVPGCSAMWWVLPAHDVVIALTVNADGIGDLVDDVVVPIVTELTGVRVPSHPVPPPAVLHVDSGRYAGRYATPLAEYEVTAAGATLTIRSTPLGLAAAMGRQPQTHQYVPLADATYITTEPVDGRHSTVAFIGDGRYLHAGRAAPRTSEG